MEFRRRQLGAAALIEADCSSKDGRLKDECRKFWREHEP